MNGLRSLLLRRVVACLALAGLVLPLAPVASARGTATQRLTEALGHREAVEVAVAASEKAPNPAHAFLEAYFEATGLDADEVLARLDGEALWLLTEPLSPLAVIVASTGAPVAQTLASGAAVIPTQSAGKSRAAHALRVTGSPEPLASASPRALQPRGP